MNRYLMLSAAALLGSTAPVLAADQAKQHTVHFYTASGNNSYCDGMMFQKSHSGGKKIATGLHLNEDCNGSDGQVVGTVDKKKYILNESYSSFSTTTDIYKPIKNGGKWDLTICYNGSSCFDAGTGIYKLGFPTKHGGKLSTTSKVGEMIAARKAERASSHP